MSWIDVGCAIIRRRDMLLIAQRCPGDTFGGYWEFPGGKREPGESIEDCLVREVREELAVEVRPAGLLCVKEHSYPGKNLRLFFVFCDWLTGVPVRHGCHDFRWIRPEELRRFWLPPADADVIQDLIQRKHVYFRRR